MANKTRTIADTLQSDFNCRKCGEIQRVLLVVFINNHGFSCKKCNYFNEIDGRSSVTRIIEIIRIAKEVSASGSKLEKM